MQKFQKPSEATLRSRLTPEQYRVTQDAGTERPFENDFWDNEQPGIYVDVVSGEPLFSSLDQFDSGCGWPSFDKPLEPERQVMTRHLAAPIEWFETEHSWAEKNALYVEKALELGEAAARCALRRAKLQPEDIDAIIFVSSTGLATPSLDSHLIKRLNLSRNVVRLPVWGLGCAGGAAGLSRAADHARSNPGSTVLLVAAELCSLTFQRGDLSKSNLIAASLFADGAAAVIVGPGTGPALVGSYSTLLDDTEDIMGWDLNDSGMKVRFSKDVPALVGEVMRSNMTEAAEANELRFDNIKHFVTHPGGLKVLKAYAETLGLAEGALEDSYAVLASFGNMSSVSVLFVLERFMRRWAKLPAGEIGAVSAMGPGFSVEHAFFRT